MLCTLCIWITICLSVVLTDEKLKHIKNPEKQERKGLPKGDADVFVTFLRPDASSAVLNDKTLVNLYTESVPYSQFRLCPAAELGNEGLQ